ncbi:MAG: hypothetical protein AAFS10_25695, partial [Myxococcota bacterium]
AQKCTGKAKKPVFLFAHHVVKGPWRLPKDGARLSRELGRAAVMRAWARPEHPDTVLKPSLLRHPDTQGVYLVTDALHRPETEDHPWVIEAESVSVSLVGPRTLQVVSRASTGVVRVSDRVKAEPEYLQAHPEVWEHLVHRCLLGCGDSGLHNMLVRPSDDRAIGVDLDENRRLQTLDELPEAWMGLLFKSRPSRKTRDALERARQTHHRWLVGLIAHLGQVCDDDVTRALFEEHGLEPRETQAILARIASSLLAY